VNSELRTSRLRLVPITFEIADASLNDRQHLSEIVGARVADGWPNPDFADALPYIRADVRRKPTFANWSRAIIHANDNVVIGDAGFKSLPNKDGSIEIGYGIASSYRNQGLAAEAARALIAWAFEHADVRQVTAECREDNFASKRVLEKLGMDSTGTQSTKNGTLLKWRIRRPDVTRGFVRD
jgi:[ribosomal protein S5]-alanine N-acetyltransferase